MPRGKTPRQPARTGRQDRVARTPPSAKPAPKTSRGSKGEGGGSSAHVGTAALGRPGGATARSVTKLKKQSYNPLAPERICRNSAPPRPTLSRRHLRAHSHQRMGTAGRDHSLRAIDRREREPRHAGTLPQISHRSKPSPRSRPNNSSPTSARPAFSATNRNPWWARRRKSSPTSAARFR